MNYQTNGNDLAEEIRNEKSFLKHFNTKPKLIIGLIGAPLLVAVLLWSLASQFSGGSLTDKLDKLATQETRALVDQSQLMITSVELEAEQKNLDERKASNKDGLQKVKEILDLIQEQKETLTALPAAQILAESEQTKNSVTK